LENLNLNKIKNNKIEKNNKTTLKKLKEKSASTISEARHPGAWWRRHNQNERRIRAQMARGFLKHRLKVDRFL
jgi:parvulin-like peptidyl-prolyl isomerase